MWCTWRPNTSPEPYEILKSPLQVVAFQTLFAPTQVLLLPRAE
jgi:hypothetical protein